MEIKAVIKSQYQATLEMLRQAIVQCPAGIWNDANDQNPFWHVAYHVLFYVHLYMRPGEQDFTAWEHHRPDYELFNRPFWLDHEPVWDNPYTPDEILAYFDFVRERVDASVDAAEMDAESGFDWLPMSKLECHIYSIRHTQHHAAELYERLGSRANLELPWVGMRPEQQ